MNFDFCEAYIEAHPYPVRRKRRWPFVAAALALLALVAVLRAGDIVVAYDFAGGTLTTQQQGRIEATRSLWDWLVLDNGLDAPSDKIRIIITPAPLTPGVLADTETGVFYRWNRRGKLVLDGAWPVIVRLNTNAGLARWPDIYLESIVAHEIGHALGFNSSVWMVNGTTTNGLYTGPALSVWRQEYPAQAQATSIPTNGDHLEEWPDTNSLMSWGIAYPGTYTYFSTTTLAIVRDNGWTVREEFAGALLRDLLPAYRRRYLDEDGLP